MPQQRDEIRPDGIEHARFARRDRMQAVILHECRIQRHAGKQERDQRHLRLPRQIGIQVREAIAIARTVVRWQPYPEQQHAGPRILRQCDHVGKIVVDDLQRQAAQSVVGAQLQQHHCRMVQGQQMGQSFQAATAGLATDAGVDDLVLVPLAVEPPLQQRDPAFCGLESVRRTQAVTEAEDDVSLRGRRALESDEQQCQCECPAAR